MGRAIVAAQLAMTLALLTGAGLLGRSLLQVLSVDPGFRTDDVVAMDLELPEPADLKPAAESRLRRPAVAVRQRPHPAAARDSRRRAGGRRQRGADGRRPARRHVPAGEPAGESRRTSRSTAARRSRPGAAAPPTSARRRPSTSRRSAFRSAAAGSSTIATASTRPTRRWSPSRSRRLRWPNQDPIGQTIQFGNMDGDLHLLTVVGVVGDTREYGLEEPPRPTAVREPAAASRGPDFTVVMHAAADPGR